MLTVLMACVSSRDARRGYLICCSSSGTFWAEGTVYVPYNTVPGEGGGRGMPLPSLSCQPGKVQPWVGREPPPAEVLCIHHSDAASPPARSPAVSPAPCREPHACPLIVLAPAASFLPSRVSREDTRDWKQTLLCSSLERWIV